jgi:hypothetical protein
MDPMLAMRTGSVPYWALFGTQPSLDRLAGYLSRTARYNDIRRRTTWPGASAPAVPPVRRKATYLGISRALCAGWTAAVV